MKYIQNNYEQIDAAIEQMFDLSMENSAFKRVIPTAVKTDLRNQYIQSLYEEEYKQQMEQKSEEKAQSVTTQVIKVNITSLREAGYCCCPKELAAACEQLLRQQVEQQMTTEQESLNNLTEDDQKIKMSSDKVESDSNADQETTNSKSNDMTSELSDLDKILDSKKVKNFPKKMTGNNEFKKTSKKSSGKAARAIKKRKYFTKYMSEEFSKDVEPVTMSMMDAPTQEMFKNQQFNELVSEITGMN